MSRELDDTKEAVGFWTLWTLGILGILIGLGSALCLGLFGDTAGDGAAGSMIFGIFVGFLGGISSLVAALA